MHELHDENDEIRFPTTSAGLPDFIDAVRADAAASPDDVANPTLDRYLEAMSALLRDSPDILPAEGAATISVEAYAKALFYAVRYE
jgi:hypothetical protein